MPRRNNPLVLRLQNMLTQHVQLDKQRILSSLSKISRFRMEQCCNWHPEPMVVFRTILPRPVLHLDRAGTDHSDEHELLHWFIDNFCDDRGRDTEANQEDKVEE